MSFGLTLAVVDALVLDAREVITLAGCGVLEGVLPIAGCGLFSRPIVLSLREPSCTALLEDYLRAGGLTLVEIVHIVTSQSLALLTQYRLGDGETECLVACGSLGCALATDDMTARRAGTQLYGSSRLTCSLGLLRDAVSRGADHRRGGDGVLCRSEMWMSFPARGLRRLLQT
jgi:hypothetical protein